MLLIFTNFAVISVCLWINPLTPKGDKLLISLNSIAPESNKKVMRLKEMMQKLNKVLIVRKILFFCTQGNI